METRVIEDREEIDGKLIEVARDYYAMNRQTLDVYYFGDDVDIYQNGKVVGHAGSWHSGVDGARFGLMLPGKQHRGRPVSQPIREVLEGRYEMVRPGRRAGAGRRYAADKV